MIPNLFRSDISNILAFQNQFQHLKLYTNINFL